MLDLRADLDNLWRASGRLTSAKGGKAVMFVAANAGAGTSSVAASFALMAAQRARRATWLVDLDLQDNPLINAFQDKFAHGVGAPGRAYDASLGAMPFFGVSAPGQSQMRASLRQGKLLAAHQIEGSRLLVTRFRNEQLAYGQKVQISKQADWWKALRRSADWIVVDAPALEASEDGLHVAAHMDGVVIVVGADKTSTEAVTSLKDEIETAGGHVLGVVMNQVRKDALFADRLAG